MTPLALVLGVAAVSAITIGTAWALAHIHAYYEVKMLRAKTVELATQAEIGRQVNEAHADRLHELWATMKGKPAPTVVPLHPVPPAS